MIVLRLRHVSTLLFTITRESSAQRLFVKGLARAAKRIGSRFQARSAAVQTHRDPSALMNPLIDPANLTYMEDLYEAVRPMMYIALTYDHRLIDGREAVVFLKQVKSLIEEPARLLLEF